MTKHDRRTQHLEAGDQALPRIETEQWTSMAGVHNTLVDLQTRGQVLSKQNNEQWMMYVVRALLSNRLLTRQRLVWKLAPFPLQAADI